MRWFKRSRSIHAPGDVPSDAIDRFVNNYDAITHNTDRLFLFAADQKLEHLNQDFYGSKIPLENNDPRHLFSIAAKGNIGVMACHLGLVARYAREYPKINYLIKLNGKTNLCDSTVQDPKSFKLWGVNELIKFKDSSGIPIRAVGYTVYLGSTFEAEMLTQAAQIVFEAHQRGLVVVLWMYPRGKSVKNESDGALIAGAAGVAAELGADFAKIKYPDPSDGKTSNEWLAIAAQAAGKTKILCSGGHLIDQNLFLQRLYEQIHQGHASGCATGRNIHQKKLHDAVSFTKTIYSIVYKNKVVQKT